MNNTEIFKLKLQGDPFKSPKASIGSILNGKYERLKRNQDGKINNYLNGNQEPEESRKSINCRKQKEGSIQFGRKIKHQLSNKYIPDDCEGMRIDSIQISSPIKFSSPRNDNSITTEK